MILKRHAWILEIKNSDKGKFSELFEERWLQSKPLLKNCLDLYLRETETRTSGIKFIDKKNRRCYGKETGYKKKEKVQEQMKK